MVNCKESKESMNKGLQVCNNSVIKIYSEQKFFKEQRSKRSSLVIQHIMLIVTNIGMF